MININNLLMTHDITWLRLYPRFHAKKTTSANLPSKAVLTVIYSAVDQWRRHHATRGYMISSFQPGSDVHREMWFKYIIYDITYAIIYGDLWLSSQASQLMIFQPDAKGDQPQVSYHVAPIATNRSPQWPLDRLET